MKYKEVIDKYFYIFMRNGAVHEVKREGKNLSEFMKNLQNKGIIVFKEEGIVINSVDISQVVGLIDYLKWINQRRPKTYILNGKMKKLYPEEDLFEKGAFGKKLLEKKEQLLLEKEKLKLENKKR